jgi:hypothetical protein
MQFSVPKFIEEKPKIVAFFTLKQFLLVAIAGFICLFLYFLHLPLTIFLPLCLLLIGSSLALAFVKIKGLSLPDLLMNFLKFKVSSTIYLWQRKAILPKIIEKEEIEKKKEKKEILELKIAAESKLKSLSARVEVGRREE